MKKFSNPDRQDEKENVLIKPTESYNFQIGGNNDKRKTLLEE